MAVCLICNNELTDTITPVSCRNCSSPFHPECAEKNDLGEIQNCKKCISTGAQNLQLPKAPKSNRTKSKLGSMKSVHSEHDVEIQLLKEQMELERRQSEEKMKLLNESHLKEKELLIRKQIIIREAASEKSDERSCKSSEYSRQRVLHWNPDFKNAEKVQQKDPPQLPVGEHKQILFLPNDVNLSSTSKESAAVGNNVNPTEVHKEAILVNKQLSSFDNEAVVNRCIISRTPIKELPKFNGDPLDWPTFIASFESSTKVHNLQPAENLIRLQQSLKGDAYEAVKGTLIFPQKVPEAIERLRLLFGRPEYIINKLQEKLMECPSPKLEKYNTIIEFATHVESMCLTMQQAKMSAHLWNPSLLQSLLQRLPTQMQREWAQFRKQYEDNAVSIEVFSHWLTQCSMDCCSLLTSPPTFSNSGTSQDKNRSKQKSFVNLHEKKNGICIVCEGDCSSVDLCEKFKSFDYKERWALVNGDSVNAKLCRHCLKGHKGRCYSKEVCGLDGCPFKHHKLLHKNCVSSPNPVAGNLVATHVQRSKNILFKFVPITLHHEDKSLKIYALLDDGSQVTLVEKWVFEALGFDGVNDPLNLQWTGNQHRSENDSVVFSAYASSSTNKFKLNRIHTVEKLDLPTQSMDVTEIQDSYEHLQGIPLVGYENVKPSMLIGLNNAKLLTMSKVKEGRDGEPVAAKTKLGWVLFGEYGTQFYKNSFSFHICECQSYENDLTDILRNFVAVDNLVVSPKTKLSKEDQRALEIMQNTTTLRENGKYEIGLLWKFQQFQFPNSYSMALKRLECLERQMNKDDNLRHLFSELIKSYITKGYARKLTQSELETKSSCWYIPMFLVKNPNKPGKIRPVWDAAACVSNVSLNTALLRGPDQLADLVGVLSRFRQYKIAICADIKEMFHQIGIRQEDQNYQRFLWRDHEDKSPDVFVMTVMTFGAKCSPSCSQYIKNVNADRFESDHPRAVKSIKLNHYVDDMMDSVESIDEAITLIKDVKHIHAAGGFQIRGWLCNSQEVLSAIQLEDTEEQFKNLDVESPGEKVLGMWWNTRRDVFTYSLKLTRMTSEVLTGEVVPTKRQVLQVLSSIYDPLGLLSHFLIFPKILMQDIWRRDLNWDDRITDSLIERWGLFVAALPEVEKIQIPRWCGFSSQSFSVDLHIFVDASLEAYAAAAYFRIENESGIHCSLIAAKSKVAPLKLLSVPRLELNAAVLGTRLAAVVKENHSILLRKTVFWTDSKTVWSWVRSESRNFQQFVAFRISEIHESTMPSQWRWLESKKNIADHATRAKIPELSSDSEWFMGPKFLYDKEELWPSQIHHESTKEELLSRKSDLVLFHFLDIEPSRFSKWERIRRCQVFVNRFVHNLLASIRHHEKRTGVVQKVEYVEAENYLFKQVQQSSFPEEYNLLSHGGAVQNRSSIKKYSPYLDINGVIRCKGRIDAAESALHDTKRPILLPGSHHLTKLILKYYHEGYLHIHHETALNSILQRFEVPKLRVEMGKVKASCQTCKNLRAKPQIPEMCGLPSARLSTFSRPFTYIGLDYFGPLTIVSGRQHLKRWGVIFTCLSVRAIHLEISHSLTTDSCILALKRFMSRRGIPAEIYSDRGTNFIGACKELKEARKQVDEEMLAEKFNSGQTDWRFNPPASPHMGGAWERLIRSVKNALFNSYPSRVPTDEVLLTMMSEIECMVNSRPLTFLPIPNEQGEVITPNHFILGSANGSKHLGTCSDQKDVLLNNWKKSQQFSERFHKLFTKNYLPVLRRQAKWFDPVREMKVGDIVLIVDEGVRSTLWKKAKVIDVKVSRDGHVRQADIQNSQGTYTRPAAKLAVLDVDGPDGISLQSDESSYQGGV